MKLFLLILFALMAIIWFMVEEFPTLSGLYVPTCAAKSRNMLIITSFAISLCIIILPAGIPSSNIFSHIGTEGLETSYTAISILSTIIVLALLKASGMKGSFLYAFIGALLVCDAAAVNAEYQTVRYFLTILASALAAFILSAGLSLLFKYTIASKRVHLIRLAARMRGVIILLIILSGLALGLNWGGFLKEIGAYIYGMPSDRTSWLVCMIFIAFCSVFGKRINAITSTESSKYYDFLLYNVLAAGISTIAVMVFFSSATLCSAIGLSAMPLAVSTILFAAIGGTEMVISHRLLEADEYIREASASLIAPAGSMLLCHIMLAFSGMDMERGDDAIELFIIVLSVIVLASIGIMIYLKRQREQRKSTEQLVRSQQQQIYEHSKALNDMEMKVILSENQALHENLEIKRQEVMNVALSICEQKEFLESLHALVKEIEESDDQTKKDELTSQLGASIRQRLSYDRDVDTSYFYAKAESVHEDFNQKLSEAFPDLTPQEKRLATLLRLGFSSKYIATLMNITPKSVEISRYRLRQKLGLGKGDNLVNYIKSL